MSGGTKASEQNPFFVQGTEHDQLASWGKFTISHLLSQNPVFYFQFDMINFSRGPHEYGMEHSLDPPSIG